MLNLMLPLLLAFSPAPAQTEASRKPEPETAPASPDAGEKPGAPAAPAAAAPTGEGLNIAVYEPYGVMPDAPAAFQFNLFALEEPLPTSLYDLSRTFAALRDDDTVPVVVFDTKDADIGLSQIQSIRREFASLKDAGKQVWMYFDAVDLGSLLLASEASRVVLLPEADVHLQGFYVEDLFFKGLLDKVGVEADIIHIGDFKSAGEPFTRATPSDEARRQNEVLFRSMYDQILTQICQARKVDRERLVALIDKGYAKASDLRDLGLVDELASRTEYIKSLRATFGRKAAIAYDHGMASAEPPKLDFSLGMNFGDLLGLGSGAPGKKASNRKEVAVVVFEGVVDASTVTPVRREILKAARTKSVRALVLRVNSPGGSALESEILWEATQRFQAAKKTLIVSMGDVAASGGYYMAAGADAIFAEPGTITGSIGVVGGKIVTKGLFDWAGITTHAYQHGRHAATLSSMTRFSDEQRALVKTAMEDIYAVFKNRVSQGRGDALQGDLEQLAGGRVYTGEQALKLGLVDRIGGLNDAIAHAAEIAKLDDYDVRLMPEPATLQQYINELLGEGPDPAEDFVRLSAGPGARRPASPFAPAATLQPALELLRRLDPRVAAAAGQFLSFADSLRRENVLLSAPLRTLRYR